MVAKQQNILFELRNETIMVNIFVNVMYKNQTTLTLICRFYKFFSLSWYQCGSTKIQEYYNKFVITPLMKYINFFLKIHS